MVNASHHVFPTFRTWTTPPREPYVGITKTQFHQMVPRNDHSAALGCSLQTPNKIAMFEIWKCLWNQKADRFPHCCYKRWVRKILRFFGFRESLSVYRCRPNFSTGHSGIMWTFWLLNVVVACCGFQNDWIWLEHENSPQIWCLKVVPRCWATSKRIKIQAPLIIEESHVQPVIVPYHLSGWKTHLHPHSSYFLLKWSVASPSAPPYSMLVTQGFLNLQRVLRNVQNMLRYFQKTPVYRDEFESPSWWAQQLSIEMILFPTPISSPPAKKVWKKREDQALFPLGTKQNLNSVYDSWYPKQ